MAETSFVNIGGVIVPGSLIPPDIDHTMQEAWTYNGQALGINPAKRAALVKARFQTAIEAHVTAAAKARGYYSDVSCASYVGSTNAAWAAEAAAFVAWRDDVWEATLSALAAWQGGGDEPTIDGLIAKLPPIVWPA